jgi:peptidoglycan hydrolase CwlO-like protein
MMANECYKNAMTQHFKNRLETRVGITVTKEQRKRIVASIRGNGPYTSSFAGITGDSHRSWYIVAFEGVGVYVLYDSKYNKLVTCLEYNKKPVEALRNEVVQANKQLDAALDGVETIRTRIEVLQTEIKEREEERDVHNRQE